MKLWHVQIGAPMWYEESTWNRRWNVRKTTAFRRLTALCQASAAASGARGTTIMLLWWPLERGRHARGGAMTMMVAAETAKAGGRNWGSRKNSPWCWKKPSRSITHWIRLVSGICVNFLWIPIFFEIYCIYYLLLLLFISKVVISKWNLLFILLE